MPFTKYTPEQQIARFWTYVDRNGPVPECRPDLGTCWLWIGATADGGYGKFWFGDPRQCRPTHRIAWELLRGPIPEDLTLDHLCRVHNCLNPDHLEPVTIRINIIRGTSIFAKEAAQTHCKRGHPLSGENLYVRPDGRPLRECLTCRRENTGKWNRLRRKERL